MCKYCANLFSGNSCEFVLSADVSVNDVSLSSVITFIGESDDGKPMLSTILMDNHAACIASDEIDIFWCPVCGRQLITCPPF